MTVYIVRYTYQGETYRHSADFTTREGAQAVIETMRADGWFAWWEKVNK